MSKKKKKRRQSRRGETQNELCPDGKWLAKKETRNEKRK